MSSAQSPAQHSFPLPPQTFPSLFHDQEVCDRIKESVILAEEGALDYVHSFHGGDTIFTRGRYAYEERRRRLHESLGQQGYAWDDERWQGRLTCSERYPHHAILLSYRGTKMGSDFKVGNRGRTTSDLMRWHNQQLSDQPSFDFGNVESLGVDAQLWISRATSGHNPYSPDGRSRFTYYLICDLSQKGPGESYLSAYLTLPYGYDSRQKVFLTAVCWQLLCDYRLQPRSDFEPHVSLRNRNGLESAPIVEVRTTAAANLDFGVSLKISGQSAAEEQAILSMMPKASDEPEIELIVEDLRQSPPASPVHLELQDGQDEASTRAKP